MLDIEVGTFESTTGGRKVFHFEIELYGEISKWGRLRALPVADEASKKEWQRSKF